MRRGRIFIYLALILILGLGAAYIFILKSPGGLGGTNQPSTPASQQVSIIVASQNIPRGKLIGEGDLSTISIPVSSKIPSEFTDITLVIGQYAKSQIELGAIITASDLSPTAGSLADTGSPWSALIPPGMTAVTIPVSRLSAVGYGIQDGDHVNLIASMLLVDVDANYQTITPNLTAGVLSPNSDSFFVGGAMIAGGTGTNVTAQSVSGLALSQQGRVELDPNFQYPFYIVPAENQRPRLVTQMVLQNVLVLHVGTFPLPGSSGVGATGAIATPVAGSAAQATVEKPDIITLVVTPQEAVTLTYLLNSGTTMTLTLRGPSDDVSRVDTEAATLQYLLSQYRIPVPAKLPYSMEPRLDVIVPPVLPNDIVPTPAP